MTVEELISELKLHPPEMEVHISYACGDYWHTQLAPSIKTIEKANIKPSDYHQIPKVVEFDDENGKEVIILT